MVQYLVMPLKEDGNPESPTCLGSWTDSKTAIKHAKSLISRDKTNKGYFVAKFEPVKKITRGYKVTSFYVDDPWIWVFKDVVVGLLLTALFILIIYLFVKSGALEGFTNIIHNFKQI